jgi:hypothetical protein
MSKQPPTGPNTKPDPYNEPVDPSLIRPIFMIKEVAKNLRDSSHKMREMVKALRESGAIDELSEAVKEATIAARDTVKEVNDATNDLKEKGVIRETLVAAEEVNNAARETMQTVKETVSIKKEQSQESPNEFSSHVSEAPSTSVERKKRRLSG